MYPRATDVTRILGNHKLPFKCQSFINFNLEPVTHLIEITSGLFNGTVCRWIQQVNDVPKDEYFVIIFRPIEQFYLYNRKRR